MTFFTPRARFTTLFVAMIALSMGTFCSDARGEELPWHDDYGAAYAQAQRGEKMLLIYFRDEADPACGRFEETTLADESVQALLEEFVLVRLPAAAEVAIEGENVTLLEHESFAHMRGQAGLAIVDLKHCERECFGHTVSCLPFAKARYYAPPYESPASLAVLLRLPAGTLTQRSMVYAIRLHPEKPASTLGRADPTLLAECEGHSRFQARWGVVGHQNFDARFQRISAKLGGGAAEVCAQSWPNEPLVEACFSCVQSWRSSPGHWQSVSSPQGAFGYDIHRGAGGAWYATGLFAGG